MSPRFVPGQENVPCVAEVVNRSLKADCTDFTSKSSKQKIMEARSGQSNLFLLLILYSFQFTTGIIFICGLN